MAQPELIYPFADILQLGTDYSVDTPDALQGEFFDMSTDSNQAVSIYSRVTMRSLDSDHFAQFEIAGVFMNKSGVMSAKNQSDTTMNRDNDGNYFRFEIVGTHIKIVCCSNLAQLCHWSGLVAVIPV